MRKAIQDLRPGDMVLWDRRELSTPYLRVGEVTPLQDETVSITYELPLEALPHESFHFGSYLKCVGIDMDRQCLLFERYYDDPTQTLLVKKLIDTKDA